MEPKMVTLPEITIVGALYRGKNENEEIPQLWDAYWPRHTEIRRRVEPAYAYGVIYNFDPQTGEFDYVAGVEVKELADVPEGMVSIELPARTYAVFDCTLPTLMATMDAIYSRWLPGSGYRRVEGPEFELYAERFAPTDDKFGMSVYIPVEK